MVGLPKLGLIYESTAMNLLDWFHASKSNLHCTRGITPKHVTSGGVVDNTASSPWRLCAV